MSKENAQLANRKGSQGALTCAACLTSLLSMYGLHMRTRAHTRTRTHARTHTLTHTHARTYAGVEGHHTGPRWPCFSVCLRGGPDCHPRGSRCTEARALYLSICWVSCLSTYFGFPLFFSPNLAVLRIVILLQKMIPCVCSGLCSQRMHVVCPWQG